MSANAPAPYEIPHYDQQGMQMQEMQSQAAMGNVQPLEHVQVGGENLIEMDLSEVLGATAMAAQEQLSPADFAQLRANEQVLAQHRIGRLDNYFSQYIPVESKERSEYLAHQDEVSLAEKRADRLWKKVTISEATLQRYHQMAAIPGYLAQEQQMRQSLNQDSSNDTDEAQYPGALAA